MLNTKAFRMMSTLKNAFCQTMYRPPKISNLNYKRLCSTSGATSRPPKDVSKGKRRISWKSLSVIGAIGLAFMYYVKSDKKQGKMSLEAASRIQSAADRNNLSSSFISGFKQRAQRAASKND